MLRALVDKESALRMARRAAASTRHLDGRRGIRPDPRVWLGRLAVRRSLALEQKTMRDENGISAQDRKSYLPRDMVLSYFQARHEEWTATGVKLAEGVGPGRGFDYHWVTDFLVELTTHLVKRVLFTLPRGAPRIAELASDARIVLVGDWGTGEGPAVSVAEQIRREIDAAGRREVHVVHLGDVYYAGTEWEARHRFLSHWPVPPGDLPHVRSWCLNGNHDMYAAGEGLFHTILTDARFARQRTERDAVTSEFHLRNEHWDVVGLDTSWTFRLTDIRGGDGHLRRRQIRWLRRRLAGSGRRRLLLTHHQPFTTPREGGAGAVPVGNLLAATAALRRDRGIDGWFWGHEHRLVTYRGQHGIRYPACMGHGAVLAPPAGPAPDGPSWREYRTTFTDSDGDRWRMPGFTVVDLDGATARVRYLDMDGAPWRAADTL